MELKKMSGDKIWENAIPKADRNGNPWSDEQNVILAEFAEKAFLAMTGGLPVRISIESVAGSGKSSVIYGCVDVVTNLELMLRVSMTAFNSHIAKDAKAKLLEAKKHGLNAVIFGGTNTVNAAGMSLIVKRAIAEGWNDVDLFDYGESRYNRIARICLSSHLGQLSAQSKDMGKVILQNAQNMMELSTSSHAFNLMSGDIVKAAQICMDEGFIPTKSLNGYDLTGTDDWNLPSVNKLDIQQISHILNTVGVNQNFGDNCARNLGDDTLYQLVAQVLTIAVKTAYMDIQMTPVVAGHDWTRYALIPNKNQRKWWMDADTLSNLIRTTDKAKARSVRFAILETAGCRFPVAVKNGNKGKGAVIVKADAEYKVVLEMVGGRMAYAFVNDGHLTRLQGKGIGTQFGLKGNAKIDGERISSWREYTNGRAFIHKGCESKVINLLTELFGADAIDNRTDTVISDQNQPVDDVISKGVLQLTMADQIYLPHALDLQVEESKKAQVMFIDEVQDLSILKAELVWRFVTDDAHIVMVGDNRQAIYAFCGASSTAFKTNAERIGATFYPMTICWRGTEMVAASVRVASNAACEVVKGVYGDDIELPDYDAHRSPLEAGYDNWDMGSYPVCISEHEIVDAYHKARELYGDKATFGLLSRIKMPIAQLMLALLSNGIPVSTPMSDDGNIIDSAFALANRVRTSSIDKGNAKSTGAKAILGLGWNKPNSMKSASSMLRDISMLSDAAFAKFSDMFKGDTKSMMADKTYTEVQGNIALLEAFTRLFFDRSTGAINADKPASTTIKNWVSNELFSDRGNNAVHIATIHRYKGDEADVMFVVDSINNPDNEADSSTIECFMSPRSVDASLESAIQEVNMVYVGYSRAKKLNVIIKADDAMPYKNDVSVRMEGAFNRDMDLMTSNTPSKVQPSVNVESDSLKCNDCGFKHHASNPDSVRYCVQCDATLCAEYSGKPESGPFGCGTPATMDDMMNDTGKVVCLSCQANPTASNYHEFADDYCKYRLTNDFKILNFKPNTGECVSATLVIDDDYIIDYTTQKDYLDYSIGQSVETYAKPPFEGAGRTVLRLYKVAGNRDTCVFEGVLGKLMMYVKDNNISAKCEMKTTDETRMDFVSPLNYIDDFEEVVE